MNVNVWLKLLDHLSEATFRMATKEMEVTVMGIFLPCKACALGKAKKASVFKTDNK